MSTVISIENVSKLYRLGQISTGTFFRDFERWRAKLMGRPDPYAKIGEQDHGNRDGDSIWALRDVSFSVKEGEILGIIGRNGAGKSTLLKILSRVTAPTSGQIKVKGRVASLLEVGTGFHPELTGRENVYLNGAILGMTKAEISRKFDEILDFAELEKFIDTPVKRYSSGMYVRLAFAVGAHLESEILVVDEVLAVGDYAFQDKCLGKMSSVSKAGRTVLFVSHNLAAVTKLTDRGLVLNGGEIQYAGPTGQAVDYYLNSSANVLATQMAGLIAFKSEPRFRAQIMQVSVHDMNGVVSGIIRFQDGFEVRIRVQVNEPDSIYYVGLVVSNSRREGVLLTTDDDLRDSCLAGVGQGMYEYRIKMPARWFPPGKYLLSFFIGPYIDTEHHYELSFEVVDVESRRALQKNPHGRGYYDYPVAPELTWEAQALQME